MMIVVVVTVGIQRQQHILQFNIPMGDIGIVHGKQSIEYSAK